MQRKLLEKTYHYFASLQEKSGEEMALMNELKSQLPYFTITHVHRDDLLSKGFDVSRVSDGDMEELARKMSNDYLEQLFWSSLEIIAEEGLEIPKMLNDDCCPKCGSVLTFFDFDAGGFQCTQCDQKWSDRYVLVQHPDDTVHFEGNGIGYPSYEQEDNGARYVTEYDYIAHFKKEPPANSYFRPVCWPDSQKYLELPDDTLTLCENINDEEGLGAFGPSAIWVPECLINEP